jgi:hypothetical protein
LRATRRRWGYLSPRTKGYGLRWWAAREKEVGRQEEKKEKRWATGLETKMGQRERAAQGKGFLLTFFCSYFKTF